jgi:lipoprotein-anchoring transpeptidase ErfK/SrfK
MRINIANPFRGIRSVSLKKLTVALAALGIVISMFAPVASSAAGYADCSNGERPTLYRGDSGSCVNLAQHELAIMGLFNAGFTDYFGPVTEQAVLDLQAAHGISQTGNIGPQTWKVLDSTQTGGGTTTSTSTTSSTGSASNLPAKCDTTRKVICIVKTTGSHATLYAVQNHDILMKIAVRTGDARGPAYITPVGDYSIGRKYTMWYSKAYNNAPMPYSMFFNGGEAIHYSSDFANNGYGGAGSSAGCVNVGTMSDAAWLYNWAPLYTSVYVVQG